MNTRAILLLACLLGASAFAGVEEDWARIQSLEAGPQAKITTREEAKRVTLEHLAVQEKALRDFIAAYPGDARVLDARLRLARLLSVRSDFQEAPALADQAEKMLSEMAADPATPAGRLADVAFVQLTLRMRRTSEPGELLRLVKDFQRAFPQDRRIGRLLLQVAGRMDSQPKLKKELLLEAQSRVQDEDLRMQIQDDLGRIERLDQPLKLQFQGLRGEEVNLESYRGNLVVICFFADWSPPSMRTVEDVVRALRRWPQVRGIGISLDQDKETLAGNLKELGVDWPIHFDAKGWESPLIRSLGINVLPTTWLLDRQGRLRALNISADCQGAIEKLMRAEAVGR